jgi:hypothetical protein
MGSKSAKMVLESVAKQSLALEMTANLCGDNPEFWAGAERVKWVFWKDGLGYGMAGIRGFLEGVWVRSGFVSHRLFPEVICQCSKDDNKKKLCKKNRKPALVRILFCFRLFIWKPNREC